MRLFVAVLIPDVIKQEAIRLRNKVGIFPEVRWVATEAIHLTLKFLGETDPSKVIEIQSLLKDSASRFPALTLSLKGGGVFPDRARPRVLWTALWGDTEPLKNLAAELDHSLEGLGFPKEEREFSPHVTVGRLKFPSMTLVDQFCTLFSQFSSPMFSVNVFHLMESKLSSQGAEYQSLGSYPLVPR